MSQTIDDRVVQLTFDNKQFESGVQQSLKTLDKLDKSLDLKDGAKGLESIQRAADKIDFSPLERGIDSLNDKFSFTETLARRFKERVSDAILDTGKSLVKLPFKGLDAAFKQIEVGGKRRAANIAQAKFQLKGLGIIWDQQVDKVKDAEGNYEQLRLTMAHMSDTEIANLKNKAQQAGQSVEEYSKSITDSIAADIDYAVSGTAYGLDSAAKAASQLAASNVQIGDDMRTALRGISGLASMTGSSYDEIANIFTKVAGTGRIMGGELREVSERGINAAATLKDYMNGVGLDTEEAAERLAYYRDLYNETKKNTQEPLAEGAKLTEQIVRTMASNGAIDFKTFAEAMDGSFGAHAKEANDSYAGSLDNVNAALSKLGAEVQGPLMNNLIAPLNSLRRVLNDLRTDLLQPVFDVFAEGSFIAFNNLSNFIDNIDEGIHAASGSLQFLKDIGQGIMNEIGGESYRALNDIKNIYEELTGNAMKSADAVEYTNKALAAVKNSEIAHAADASKPVLSLGEAYLEVMKIFETEEGAAAAAISHLTSSTEELQNATDGAAGSAQDLANPLSAITSGLQSLLGIVVELVGHVAQIALSLAPALQVVSGSVLNVVASLLDTAYQLVVALSPIASLIADIVAGLSNLLVVAIDLLNQSGIFQFIGSAISGAVQGIGDAISFAVGVAENSSVFRFLFGDISEGAEEATESLMSFTKTSNSTLTSFKKLSDESTDSADKILDAVQKVWQASELNGDMSDAALVDKLGLSAEQAERVRSIVNKMAAEGRLNASDIKTVYEELFGEVSESAEETAESTEESVDKVVGAQEEFVRAFVKGTYGNGQDRIDAFLAEGHTMEEYNAVQGKVNEAWKLMQEQGLSWDEALDKITYDTTEATEANEEYAKSEEEKAKIKARVNELTKQGVPQAEAEKQAALEARQANKELTESEEERARIQERVNELTKAGVPQAEAEKQAALEAAQGTTDSVGIMQRSLQSIQGVFASVGTWWEEFKANVSEKGLFKALGDEVSKLWTNVTSFDFIGWFSSLSFVQVIQNKINEIKEAFSAGFTENGLLGGIKGAVVKFATGLWEDLKSINPLKWFSSLRKSISGLQFGAEGKALGDIWAGFKQSLTETHPILGNVVSAIESFQSTLTSLNPFETIVSKWEAFKTSFVEGFAEGGFFTAIKDAFSSLFTSVGESADGASFNPFEGIKNSLIAQFKEGGMFEGIGTAIDGWIKTIKTKVLALFGKGGTFEWAGKAWSTVSKTLGGAFTNVKEVFSDLFSDIQDTDVWQTVSDWFSGISGKISSLFSGFQNLNLWDTISGWFEGLGSTIQSIISGEFSGVDIIGSLTDAFSSAKEAIANFFNDLFGGGESEAGGESGGTPITRSLGGTVTGLETFTDAVTTADEKLKEVTDTSKTTFERFKEIFARLWDNITNIGSKALGVIKSLPKNISAFVGAIKDFFSKVWNEGLIFSTLDGGVTDQIPLKDIVEGIKAKFKELFGGDGEEGSFEFSFDFDNVLANAQTFAGKIGGVVDTIVTKVTELKEAMQPFIDATATFFNTLTGGGSPLDAIVKAAGVFIGLDLASSLKDLTSGFADVGEVVSEGLGGALESAGTMMIGYGKAARASAREANSQAVLNMALALLALSAACLILAGIDPKDLERVSTTLIKLAVALGVLVGAWALLQAVLNHTTLGDTGSTEGPMSTFLAPIGNGLRAIGKGIGQIGRGVQILALAAVIMAVVEALERMAEITKLYNEFSEDEWKTLGKIMLGLAGFLGILAVVAKTAQGSSMLGVAATIMALCTALYMIAGAIVIYNKMGDEFETGFVRVGMVIVALGAFLTLVNGVAGYFKTGATQMLGIAVEISAIVGAVYGMGLAIELLGHMDSEVFQNGILAAGLILVGLGTFMAVVNKTSSMANPKAILADIPMMIAVVGAVYLLGLAANELGKLAMENSGQMIAGMVIIGLFMAALTATVAIINKASANVTKASAGLLTLVGLVLVIAAVTTSLKILSEIEMKPLITAAATLAGVIVALTFLMQQIKKVDWKGALVSGIMIGVVLWSITGSIAVIAGLEDTDVAQGLAALTSILALLSVLLMQVQKLELKSAIGATVLLGVLLWSISGSLALLANFTNVEDLAAAAGAMTSIIFALGRMVKRMSKYKNDFKQSAGIALIIGTTLMAIAGALALVQSTTRDIPTLAASAGAMILTMLALIPILNTLSKTKINFNKAKSIALAVGATLLAIAGSLTVLSRFGGDWYNILASAGAMMGVLVALVPMLKTVSSKSGFNMNKAKAVAATVAGVLLTISGSLLVLSKFGGGWKKILASAGAMMGVLVALVPMLKTISGMKIDKGKVLSTAGTIAIVLGAVAVSIGALSNLGGDWQSMIAAAGSIGLVLVALAGSMALMSAFGDVGKIDIGTIAAMCLELGVVALAIGALCQVKNIDKALPVAAAMSIALLALAGTLAILSKVGPSATAALPAALVLGAVLVIIGAALGAAFAAFSVIASLGSAQGMKIAGQGLTAFMEEMKGFTAAASEIKGADAAKGIAVVVGACTAFAVGSVMSAIGEWAKGKGGDIVASSQEMTTALTALKEFGNVASTISMSDASEGIGLLVKAVAAFAVSELITAFTDWVVPEGTDLGKVGEELTTALTGLEGFVNKVNEMSDSLGDFQNVSEALGFIKDAVVTFAVAELITALVDFVKGAQANGIEDGEQMATSLGDVGKELSAMMDSLKPFIQTVNDIADQFGDDIDPGGMEKATQALGFILKAMGTWALAELMQTLVEFVDGLSGDKVKGGQGEKVKTTLADVGTELSDMMTALKPFVQTVRDIANEFGSDVDPSGLDNATKGLGFILKAMGTWTLAELMTSLVSFVDSLGQEGVKGEEGSRVKTTLNGVATELSDMMTALIPFIETVKSIADTYGTDVDPGGLKNATDGLGFIIKAVSTWTLAELMTTLVGFIENLTEQKAEGKATDLTGVGTELSNMFDALIPFISLVKTESERLGGFEDAAAGFDLIIDAVKTMAEADFYNLLSSFFQSLVGEDNKFNVEEFKTQMQGLGEAVVAYADCFKDVDIDETQNTSDIATALGDMVSNLDLGGGWFKDDKLVALGNDLGVFGPKLATFFNIVKGISVPETGDITGGLQEFIDFVSENTGENSVLEKFSDFGEALKALVGGPIDSGLEATMPDYFGTFTRGFESLTHAISMYEEGGIAEKFPKMMEELSKAGEAFSSDGVDLSGLEGIQDVMYQLAQGLGGDSAEKVSEFGLAMDALDTSKIVTVGEALGGMAAAITTFGAEGFDPSTTIEQIRLFMTELSGAVDEYGEVKEKADEITGESGEIDGSGGEPVEVTVPAEVTIKSEGSKIVKIGSNIESAEGLTTKVTADVELSADSKLTDTSALTTVVADEAEGTAVPITVTGDVTLSGTSKIVDVGDVQDPEDPLDVTVKANITLGNGSDITEIDSDSINISEITKNVTLSSESKINAADAKLDETTVSILPITKNIPLSAESQIEAGGSGRSVKGLKLDDVTATVKLARNSKIDASGVGGKVSGLKIDDITATVKLSSGSQLDASNLDASGIPTSFDIAATVNLSENSTINTDNLNTSISGVSMIVNAALSLGNGTTIDTSAAVEMLQTAGDALSAALTEGFVNGDTGGMSAKARSAGSQAASAASSVSGQFYNAGVNFSTGLGNGISARLSWVAAKAREVALAAYNAARAALNEHSPSKAMETVGEFFDLGFANGISESTKAVTDESAKMASSSLAAARDVLEINSPSAIMQKYGKWFDEGFLNGINSGSSGVLDAVVTMMDGALTAAGGTAAQITNVVMSSMKAMIPQVKTAQNEILRTFKDSYVLSTKKTKKGKKKNETLSSKELKNVTGKPLTKVFDIFVKYNVTSEGADEILETVDKDVDKAQSAYDKAKATYDKYKKKSKKNKKKKKAKKELNKATAKLNAAKNRKSIIQAGKNELKSNDEQYELAEESLAQYEEMFEPDVAWYKSYWEGVRGKLKKGTDAWKKADQNVRDYSEGSAKHYDEMLANAEKQYDDESKLHTKTAAETKKFWEDRLNNYVVGSKQYNDVLARIEDAKDQARAEQWQNDQEEYERQSSLHTKTLEENYAFYDDLLKNYQQGTDEYDAVLKMRDSYAFGTSNYYEDMLNTQNEALAKAKERRDVSVGEELQFWKEMLGAFEQGTDEYDEVLKNIESANNSIYKSMNSAQKTLEENIKKTNEDLQKQINDIWKKREDDLKEKGKSYAENVGGIFDYFTSSTFENSDTLISNLKSQVNGLEEFGSELDKLRARSDVPEELMDALEKMGPKSTENLKNLNAMTDEQLSEYISLYNRRLELGTQRADIESMKDYEKQIEDATKNANERIEEYRKNYQDTIDELGISLTKSSVEINDKIAKAIGGQSGTRIVEEINKDLGKNYENFLSIGDNIVSGISEGMDLNLDSLTDKIKLMCSNMMAEAQKTLQIHSPSRVFAFYGQMIDMGLIQGLEDYEAKVVAVSNDVAEESIDAMKDAISVASYMADMDDDWSPVITPVFDDSQIEEGIGYIQTLLNRQNMAIQMGTYNQIPNLPTKSRAQIQNEMLSGVIDELAKLVSANDDNAPVTQNNTFNITGNDPKAIANEVSRIINKQLIKKEKVWA